jgi:hypothetical protein
MIHASPDDWLNAPHKRIALFGMSGLGKTWVSNLLRDGGNWFHYSVDYRIGTRYMGEHIVDNFKREAMRNPFLRALLMQDSIHIASNITFENLAPLSTYLGKPGDPARGGIAFAEYIRRQRQHREAEIAATRDATRFIGKAQEIYGYDHFVADTSGSLCEVADPANAADPVLGELSAHMLPVWIRGTADDTEKLVARFDRHPKPIYYNEDFLRGKWQEYLALRGVGETTVDPDHFIRWGYRELVSHRLPVYAAIARAWGVTVDAAEISAVQHADDFVALIARALERRA